jgi:amidophosphoribosyltransferase
VVVDDSIVRGTTSRKIVKMLKAAGAVEVHLRISSPPTSWPCYYGIDTPSRQELIASNHATEEIARFVTADTLGYLSLEGLGAAVGDRERATFCTACFSGKYLAGEMSAAAAQSAKAEPLPEAVAAGSAVATGPQVLPDKHLSV